MAYLFYVQPEALDKTKWVSAVVLLAWSVYNSPLVPVVAGYGLLSAYRRRCVRAFGQFGIASAIVTAVVLASGGYAMRDLWARWSYVDLIKQLTHDEGLESVPLANAEDLATAFNLYPHRREVPFIVARMSRLLAFDDETSNYNLFAAAFLAKIRRAEVESRYARKAAFEKYEGAIDPILYLARTIVDAAGATPASLREAIELLKKRRPNDELAGLYLLVFEHELLDFETDAQQALDRRESVRKRIFDLLESIRRQTSTKAHIRLVTSHVFQEVLDHYAQVHIQLADARQPAPLLETIVGLYGRILTVRRQIATASEVPWLDGPGKFTIYHYFKHRVGRESEITRRVMQFHATVPGLKEALDRRIFSAEANRSFGSSRRGNRALR